MIEWVYLLIGVRTCILIVIICVLLLGFIYVWQKENKALNYKANELELLNAFRNQEQQLYDDVRKKQHEFKNQLSALYSTHYTCETYEELVNAQQKYADWIKRDNCYNDLVLSCKPAILAGFIYNQLECAKDNSIQVEYSVKVIDIKDMDREYDYICVFGILFDNAVEAVENHPVEKRKIKLVFDYDGINTRIEIRNIHSFVKAEEIKQWFNASYSTKGRNRGLGLSNIEDMKKKYKAEVIVENIDRQGENWISICFSIFPK